MTSREVSKLLRGRKIARVELNSGGKSNGGTPLQNVEIHLEGGGLLAFCVQTSDNEYGVTMLIAGVTEPGEVLFTDKPRSESLRHELVILKP